MSHPGGRPPMFYDPEDMAHKIILYFKKCDENTRDYKVTDKEGNVKIHSDPWPIKYTMTGLALHLGFESRQSLYDYAKKEEFAYIIKNALLRIENQVEMEVRECDKPTGAIFVLKNMGWSDKSEIEHKGLKEVPQELTVRLVSNSDINPEN